VIIGIIALTGAIKFIRKIWSPIVLGAMIIMIGLAVAGLGLEYMVQDGWDLSFAVAFLLALGGSYLAIKGKGIWGTLPPLLIIGLGFILFITMGEVDFSFVQEAPLLATPEFLPYGFEMPPLDLVIIMLLVNLMAALNLYGNIHGYAQVIDEEVSEKQEKNSFTIFGFLETTVPGLFGVPATVSYGENMGIVQLTKVAARSFIIVAAIIFIVLAFFGPFIGLMAAIPKPIAGAVLLGIASTVIGIGADTFQTAPQFARREQTLVGFSIFLSLGLSLLPDELWNQTPRIVNTIFSNPVISVILFVIIFERIIFRQSKDEKKEKKEEKED
jgi:xanthine/uracil permease